jgi:hypothetical protein
LLLLAGRMPVASFIFHPLFHVLLLQPVPLHLIRLGVLRAIKPCSTTYTRRCRCP